MYYILSNNPIENPYNFEEDQNGEFFDHLQQQFEIHEWTIEKLIDKIERNEWLNDADLLAPNLLDYEKKITDTCKKFEKKITDTYIKFEEKSTAADMLEILTERRVLNEIEEIIGEKLQPMIYDDMDNKIGCVVRKQHVVVLTVKGKNIKKISSSIGNLKYLRYLILSDNNLETLPLSISNLKKIVFIDIKNNNFSDLPFLFIECQTEIGFEGNPWNDEALEYIKLWKENEIKEFFKEQLEKWTLESLLERISQNQPLRVIDRFQNDLCKFVDEILIQCRKTKTETAQKIIDILEERCMIKIGKEKLKIWK